MLVTAGCAQFCAAGAKHCQEAENEAGQAKSSMDCSGGAAVLPCACQDTCGCVIANRSCSLDVRLTIYPYCRWIFLFNELQEGHCDAVDSLHPAVSCGLGGAERCENHLTLLSVLGSLPLRSVSSGSCCSTTLLV